MVRVKSSSSVIEISRRGGVARAPSSRGPPPWTPTPSPCWTPAATCSLPRGRSALRPPRYRPPHQRAALVRQPLRDSAHAKQLAPSTTRAPPSTPCSPQMVAMRRVRPARHRRPSRRWPASMATSTPLPGYDAAHAGRHRSASCARSSTPSSGRPSSSDLEYDLAYSLPDVSRFRVNLFQQRNSYGSVMRAIPHEHQAAARARHPRADRPLRRRCRAGSCSSPARPARARRRRSPRCSTWPTAPAATTSSRSKTRSSSCTQHKKCVVNQRELGVDTHGFADALKHVLRQDPDIILVGEMRDLETVSTALTAAETGHLVLATLHTQSAAQTIDRVIDMFPAHQQQEIRAQLSTALQGVVTQSLARRPDGSGRTVVCEVMFATAAIRNLIREGKNHQIPSFMQSSRRRRHAHLRRPPGPARARRRGRLRPGADPVPRAGRVQAARRTVCVMTAVTARARPSPSRRSTPRASSRKGTVDAQGRGVGGRRSCARQGVMPLTHQRVRQGPAARRSRSRASATAVGLKDLAIFARQFATMTSSGSVAAALAGDPRGAGEPSRRSAAALRDVRRDIEGGLVALRGDEQARQDLPAADDRDDPGRRDRRLPRRRSRPDRRSTSRRTRSSAPRSSRR